VLIALLVLPSLAGAAPVAIKEYGCSLDLPEGWEPRDASNPAKLSFADPTGGGLMQMYVYGHEAGLTAEQMGNTLGAQLKATGDGAVFVFSGRNSYLMDISFQSSGQPFQGYVLVVKDVSAGNAAMPSVDAVLIVFAPADVFASDQAGLLSALDSFSPDPAGLLLPGPISQFLSPFPDSQAVSVPVRFLGRNVNVRVGSGEQDAGQALVEREAQLLSAYPAGDFEPWKRFYRMIYRDGYGRMDGILSALSGAMTTQNVQKEQVPLTLLSWIQGFTYQRTGTLADFLSPLDVVISGAGDCDSRAILYDILLDHLGYRTMLFVSERFSHALAGVNIDRQGASMSVDGTRYIVAEMTAAVAIGLIDSSMADPTAWIPMPLK
jgi:hypothetical protein